MDEGGGAALTNGFLASPFSLLSVSCVVPNLDELIACSVLILMSVHALSYVCALS